jgi:membrane-bound ClpP family serine protease
MYEGYGLAALLLGIGVILFISELLLPTHGLLGVVGGCTILASVFVAMKQNAWVGLALLLVCAAATPLLWMAFVKIWPRTPIGRRLVLPELTPPPPAPPVRVGQTGVAVSELRPMGMCEFDDGTRIESYSEHGIIPAGTTIKVIALVNNKPTVRVA